MRIRLRHERLRDALQRGRVSQNRWAQMLGLGKSHLSMLVNGQRPYPSADTRDKLLRGLGMRFEDLFVIEAAETPHSEEITMSGLFHDLSSASRRLRSTPLFTAVTVLTLALGIGANTALFGLVDVLLLRPLPVENPDRLVRLFGVQPERGIARGQVSPANLLDWRVQSRSFAELAAFRGRSFNLAGEEEPERVLGLLISDGFLETLGIAPQLGRGFSADEYAGLRDDVVLVSDSLWQRRWGRDPTAVGRRVRLDRGDVTIVGVLPPEMHGTAPALGWVDAVPDVFAPLSLDPDLRQSHYLFSIGRLEETVSPAAAQSEMTRIAAGLEAAHPDANSGYGVHVVSAHEVAVGELREMMIGLWLAGGAVLLVVCVNVANLLMGRSKARSRELAVRKALGADRRRILQAVLSESLLLSLGGGALGILLAAGAIRGLPAMLPGQIPRLDELAVDGRLVFIAALVSVASAAFAGLHPALRSAHGRVADELGAGRAPTGSGERTARRSLIVAEVAVAAVLMIGAGLLLKSYARLTSVDPGFETRGVLSFYTIPRYNYDGIEEQTRFLTRVLRRVESLPGVESVGTINFLPLTENDAQETIQIDGIAAPPDQPHWAHLRAVDSGYFGTMRIAIPTGRDFERSDMDAGDVAIVSESLAARYWPEDDAIGQRLRRTRDDRSEWMTVVGVAADTAMHGVDEAPAPVLYVPYTRDSYSTRGVVIRTSGDPLDLAGTARAAVLEINPDQSVFSIAPMTDRLAAAVAPQRFALALMAAFAALTLVLAIVGVHAVMAQFVGQRIDEIGVRMALGARRSQVATLVLREGLAVAGAGAVVGGAGALIAGRLIAGSLYGVTPFDPGIIAGVLLTLALAAAAATLAPALRAAATDPAVTLRR